MSVIGRARQYNPARRLFTAIDPQAAVIGDVTIGAGSSIWPFAVLRRNQDNYVTLGRNSNVHDNSVLHVTREFACIVGDFVTIGHRAVVHGLPGHEQRAHRDRAPSSSTVPSWRRAPRWGLARWCRPAKSSRRAGSSWASRPSPYARWTPPSSRTS